MDPADPRVSAWRTECRALLNSGHPISHLGRDRGGPLPISQQRVYHYARRAALPHNVPVAPGGAKERRILAMRGLGYTDTQICEVHSLSPNALVTIVNRARREEGMDNPD